MAFLCGKVGVLGGWGQVCGRIVLLEGRLVGADGAAAGRNERRDPSGFRLCGLPGHRERRVACEASGALVFL